jgi:hypothetical protein
MRRKETQLERDNQKSRVYRAERQTEIFVAKNKLEPLTIKECQKFVNKVLARKAITKVYGKRMITVEAGRGGARAFHDWRGRVISAGVWARQPAVLLHEIAHHLAPYHAVHGPEFATILANLYRQILGKDAEEKLLASFALNGVQVCGANKKPRKARCPKSQKAWYDEKKAA